MMNGIQLGMECENLILNKQLRDAKEQKLGTSKRNGLHMSLFIVHCGVAFL